MQDPRCKISCILYPASCILFAGYRFTSLHGYFGVHGISYPLSFLISLFFIIGITNAFNLIDGVDGLSGSLALTAFATFGGWFFINRDYSFALLCASAIGSIIAFLRYNLWSVKNKIFLGDDGASHRCEMMALRADPRCKISLYPLSCVPHPASRILYPASRIPHPASSIPHLASCILHPASSRANPPSTPTAPTSTITSFASASPTAR